MLDALLVHRLHFAYTVTFHYLFPQLTMGLALLIVILKTLALRTGDEQYNDAARFWAHIFGINFAMGVVTGIPMEFQFGTNWAQFSRGCRRRDWPDVGHGRRVLVLSGIELPRTCSFTERSAWAPRATGGLPSWSLRDRGFPAT